jgi:uncharacterized protein
VKLHLAVLPGKLAVCRLTPDAPSPEWASGSFLSVTRTADELSIICDEAAVPADVRAERSWRAMRVQGPIPFATTGVAAALVSPLAAAAISVFLIATFDTDYLLVKEYVLVRAVDVLRAAGHEVA